MFMLVLCRRVLQTWDVTANDPRLLMSLKAYRNSVPVPRHWANKRKYLQGKRGVVKPAFELPGVFVVVLSVLLVLWYVSAVVLLTVVWRCIDFIRNTGISMHDAWQTRGSTEAQSEATRAHATKGWSHYFCCCRR